MALVTFAVDSREKEPYSFDPQRVRTIHRALSTGDYSLAGWESSVTVERKTLEDFVSTVIHARKRFQRELCRLREYETACVVVEANLRDLVSGNYNSGAHPNAILGAVISIVVDFQVPVFFCSDRQVACRFVEGFLLRFHRRVTSQCKVAKTQTP